MSLKQKVGVECSKIRACNTRSDAIFQLGRSMKNVGGLKHADAKHIDRLYAAFDRNWGKVKINRTSR